MEMVVKDHMILRLIHWLDYSSLEGLLKVFTQQCIL